MTSPTPRDDTVGFIGLGMMGSPMAENLLAHGHPLVCLDLARDRMDRLVALGATAAAQPAAVMRAARTVIIMVETTQQTHDVIFGPRGLSESAVAGDLVIVMSTVDMMALRRMHAELLAKDIDLIDAPVTGMREKGGAKGAALKCYAGGREAAVDRARPILASMTSEVTRFGEIGLGTAMKIVKNMLMQVNRVVIAEALAMGTRAGLDPRQMVDTIAGTSGDSTAFRHNAPRMLARDFDGIRMDITAKDVALQAALGQSLGMPMFMAPMALQVHQIARSMGLGDLDASALVQVYEQWTAARVAGGDR